MYLSGKTVFLAGATGMAGSAVTRRILEDHPTTRIRAPYHRTEPFIMDGRVEYMKGDLRSKEDCRRIARGCDCAVMAAANTTGSGSIDSQSWPQVNDNLAMNARMVEAFELEGVRRVVYIGTATLYQEYAGKIKEDELDMAKDPHRAYFGLGWLSRYMERLLSFWSASPDSSAIIARASNIFGPFAKFDPEKSNFIPAIIRRAEGRIDPFTVWGSPDVTRDVIYSDDFARAIVMMLNADDIRFDVFNVGSGEGTSLGDVVEWALKYSGHHPSEVRYDASRPAAVKERNIDCSKIGSLLGWRPMRTCEEGVKETVKWWHDNKGWWAR